MYIMLVSQYFLAITSGHMADGGVSLTASSSVSCVHLLEQMADYPGDVSGY